MSAMRYAASRIGKVAAATRRRQQQSVTQHRSHPRPATERAPEQKIGPYNIWEYGEESNYGPAPRMLMTFSSAEERNAYLTEKRAREKAEQNSIAEYWRRIDERRELLLAQRREEILRAREEQRAADLAENAATANMNCVGRTCKRAMQFVKGTHKINGTRKEKTDGGRRRNTRRSRKNEIY